MEELDLMDAEAVGFDGMELANLLPGVLQDTGKALTAQEADKKKADDAKKPGAPPASGDAPAKTDSAAKPSDSAKDKGGGGIVATLTKLPMPAKVGAGALAAFVAYRLLAR